MTFTLEFKSLGSDRISWLVFSLFKVNGHIFILDSLRAEFSGITSIANALNIIKETFMQLCKYNENESNGCFVVKGTNQRGLEICDWHCVSLESNTNQWFIIYPSTDWPTHPRFYLLIFLYTYTYICLIHLSVHPHTFRLPAYPSHLSMILELRRPKCLSDISVDRFQNYWFSNKH
jgi:hypothetical protein